MSSHRTPSLGWEIDMTKSHWIAHLTITDPEIQKKYVAANRIAFDKYGGKSGKNA